MLHTDTLAVRVSARPQPPRLTLSPLVFFPSLPQLTRGRGGGGTGTTAHMHTTDPGGGPGMQSVLEAGDLEELMAMVSGGREKEEAGMLGEREASAPPTHP